MLYRYFRDRDDLRDAIADKTINSVVESVLPHLMISPDATPRQIITMTVTEIVGWFDEHPNLYSFLRSRRGGPGLDAVENTLADRVATLLKVFLVLFGLDTEQAEPGAYGIVGLVESSGCVVAGQTHDAARAFHPLRLRQRLAPARRPRARQRHRHRLRRPAATRRAGRCHALTSEETRRQATTVTRVRPY